MGSVWMSALSPLSLQSNRPPSLPAQTQTAASRSNFGTYPRGYRARRHACAAGLQPEQRPLSETRLKWQAAVVSAMAPLLLAKAPPALAQVDPFTTASFVDSMTVPALFTTLMSGAVYAALQSKETKDVLSQLKEGIRTEEAPQGMADSTSPLVKGLQDPMKAANEAADRAAHALEDMTTEAQRTLPPRPSMAAPEAEIGSSGQGHNEPARPLRQLASATTEETQATRKVQDADQAFSNKQTVAATVQPAVDTLPPKVPVVSAASAAPEPDMNSPRPQNIFDLAVETRKRMQREYERKMASIRDATAQKQADETKRQQQRKAAISRLQNATESQAARERMDAARQEHPATPVSRLLALVVALWAWLQRQVSKLIHRGGSSGSGAPSAA